MADADATTTGSHDSMRRLLFVVAILASAFLVFLVQPMVAKRILPWFGGAPSVWTLCLAFYQTMLFFGYGYAHLLIRFASPTLQAGIHLLLVAASLLLLPILPDDSWQPAAGASPRADLLLTLLSNVALPFIVLASTAPLVQAWFARIDPERSPYPLYAVSNAGSFAALLIYPFVLEPRLALSTTGTLWSIGFAAAAAAILGCSAIARLTSRGVEAPNLGATWDSGGGQDQLQISRVVLWLLLSSCAVVLLMGITNSICLDVASVPFLWILPLATYLLTFMLCFASERLYRPLPYVVVTVIALLPTLALPLLAAWGIAPAKGFVTSVTVQIPSYCALLFGSCMILHGQLYRLRPSARSLTSFYLCVSGGGALGGLFVGLLAPVLFDDHYEVRAGIGFGALLLLAATAYGNRAPGRSGVEGWRWAIAAPAAVMLLAYALWPIPIAGGNLLHQERGFFGVIRVMEPSATTPQRQLLSGNTLHGVQFLSSNLERIPTAYFGRATGVGLALAQRIDDNPLRVGVIGLGIGTLSAYGRAGDYFRFYEIDPLVVQIARDAGYFSFLEDSRAEVEIVLGDARLAIADEQMRGDAQEFDFLIVDAFISDAIPLHLLTLEAFGHYADALAPEGVVALHVSNRNFDLMPFIARAGFEIGLATLSIQTYDAAQRQSRQSHWVLMSPDPERLRNFASFAERRVRSLSLPSQHLKLTRPSEADLEAVPLWTDDYSDLLSALRQERRIL